MMTGRAAAAHRQLLVGPHRWPARTAIATLLDFPRYTWEIQHGYLGAGEPHRGACWIGLTVSPFQHAPLGVAAAPPLPHLAFVTDRHERLISAHLYLVCDDQPDDFLAGALAGGVDIVQLRMKDASDDEIVTAGRRFAVVAAGHGALFILNDRPDLVVAAGADGVHVGQDDASVADSRAVVGRERILGLSTHSAEQVDAAAGAPVDYIGVGPVHETPTKPGRPAVGLELVRYAAAHATVPFFAIGGVSQANVHAVREAGAERVAVVRALTEADDVEAAARALRTALAGGGHQAEAHVGSAR
jgi:thiamine-phosphate pyrophosphorylase